MIFKWQSENEKLLKGIKISPEKKLEALRLMNELADKVLSKQKKSMRSKLRAE
jgi:hypothetical protein